MANVAANLIATHPTSMFYPLKAVSVEERNFSGENSTLVYLYLKSSVQSFTTQFYLRHNSFVSGRFPKED